MIAWTCDGCKHLGARIRNGAGERYPVDYCLKLETDLERWWDGCINRPGRVLRERECKRMGLKEVAT